jgi:hypothetical protein
MDSIFYFAGAAYYALGIVIEIVRLRRRDKEQE